jgi:FlaA1/EpsC-like NDP-sugar epimerase
MKHSDNDLKPKIIGIGAGGHCRVIIDILYHLGTFQIYGLLEQDNKRSGLSLDGVEILGDESCAGKLYKENINNAFLGVGSIGNSLRLGLLFQP